MAQFWFRRRKGLFSKDLGYGWIPISWEGWLMIVVLLALIVGLGYYLKIAESSKLMTGAVYLIGIIILVVLFGYFADKKTEDPVMFKR